MLLEYAKYLGLNLEEVTRKFNEHMFDYTSKIPMADIEKAQKEQERIDDIDRIASPYTKVYPKEKTLPYIITGIIVAILVILAVIWSINQITVNNTRTDIISYYEG
jgi:ribosomal protein S8